MSSRRIRNEKGGAKQAFEIYFGLGAKRSYQKVADQLGVSKSTIKNWATSFAWRQRLEERIAARQASPMPNGEKAVPGHIAQYLKVVEAAEALCLRQLTEGKVKPTVRELIRLIEARLDCEGMTDAEPNPIGPPIMVLVTRDEPTFQEAGE